VVNTNSENPVNVSIVSKFDSYLSKAKPKRLSSSFQTINDITIGVENEERSVLYEIFKYMFYSKYFTLKQMFGIQRVCHLWKDVVKDILLSQTTVSFGTKADFHYGCSDSVHNVSKHNELTAALPVMDGKPKLLGDERLKSIIRLLLNTESLHFNKCSISSMEFKYVINTFNRLNCLSFHSIEGIHRLDWPKLGKPLNSNCFNKYFI